MAERRTEPNPDYYRRQYKASAFHRRGDNPAVIRFWVTYIRRLRKTGVLIDVGCGEGYFLRRIAAFFETWGVDNNRAGIQAAKANSPETRFLLGNAVELPLENDAFDVVTAFDVIEHIETPESFIREAVRVLKPGGLFIIRTPNPHSFGARKKGDGWFGHRDKTHVSIFEKRTWKELLLKTGALEIVAEGTDTLWDSPYFKRVPAGLQRMFFMPVHQVLSFAKGFMKWEQGENCVFVLKKT